ncbi:hypothetical protein [Erwinia psidii]|nr:hypothetical protein [Erwinia psidii]
MAGKTISGVIGDRFDADLNCSGEWLKSKTHDDTSVLLLPAKYNRV